MRRVLVIVALLALTAPVAEATIWRVVKSGSATGDFADLLTARWRRHPVLWRFVLGRVGRLRRRLPVV
jgi:hypothetical protein